MAVAACALATTVAAGVFAGKNVVGVPLVAKTSGVAHHVPRAAQNRDVGPVPTAAFATETAAATAPYATPAVPTAIGEAAPGSVTPPALVPRAALPRTPAAADAAVPGIRRSSLADVRTAALVPGTPRRSGCEETGEGCTASRIELAEQRLADAYERAEAAGVRPRALRGYQREWDRARDEAEEQPQYALRLYAMITSDLYNLAEDARARDGGNSR